MFLSYHRSAGVDVAFVGGRIGSEVDEVLASYIQDGFVRRVETTSHTELAGVAVDEFAADWIVPSTADEFWWPRGESLKDVLAVIPPRYGVVQGLVRTFVPRENASPLQTWTVRKSLLGPDGSGGAALEELLRPVYRASPNMQIDPHDWTLGGRRVPLRAWYPIEVFRFPVGEPPLDDAQSGRSRRRVARYSTPAYAMLCAVKR